MQTDWGGHISSFLFFSFHFFFTCLSKSAQRQSTYCPLTRDGELREGQTLSVFVPILHPAVTSNNGSSNPTYRHEMYFRTHLHARAHTHTHTHLMFKLCKLERKCVVSFRTFPDICIILFWTPTDLARLSFWIEYYEHDDEYWASAKWNWQREIEVPGEKPVNVLLCPPYIPREQLGSNLILYGGLSKLYIYIYIYIYIYNSSLITDKNYLMLLYIYIYIYIYKFNSSLITDNNYLTLFNTNLILQFMDKV